MLFTYCVFLIVSNCGLQPLLYILEAVHSCLSFHVLTRTKTLPEDGTYVPKHVGAALVINTLMKPSAQCWFSMHNQISSYIFNTLKHVFFANLSNRSNLQRMPQHQIPLKSYYYSPQGKRTVGRPKKRWRQQL
jgi:hypothetical protein